MQDNQYIAKNIKMAWGNIAMNYFFFLLILLDRNILACELSIVSHFPFLNPNLLCNIKC